MRWLGFALAFCVIGCLPDTEPKSGTLARKPVSETAKDFSTVEQFEAWQGGKGTSWQYADTNAFSHVVENATDEDELNFRVGNGIFRKIWVAAPASTAASDGLGPHFDARGCQSCHIKDGRGNRGAVGALDETHVLGIMPFGSDQSQKKHPTVGAQFQRRATVGHNAEGQALLNYDEKEVTLGDGTKVTLQKPILTLSENLGDNYFVSHRVANPVIGMGLLAAISDADILANADPDDKDNDGISGRAHWVEGDNTDKLLGRFGWKAESPTLPQQIAKAFHLDMGLSSDMRPEPFGDCTPKQSTCRQGPHGNSDSFDEHEVSQTMLELVEAYVETLAVPARRKADDPKTLAGKKVFHDIGCASCHTAKYQTRENADNPLNAQQFIWPYTDMLLHDMGPGLSDNPSAENALAHEWRTPPLWGVGLTQTVNPHAGFLHDGRARTLIEAILWHGGEAKSVIETFAELPEPERAALIAFLESL